MKPTRQDIDLTHVQGRRTNWSISQRFPECVEPSIAQNALEAIISDARYRGSLLDFSARLGDAERQLRRRRRFATSAARPPASNTSEPGSGTLGLSSVVLQHGLNDRP